MNEQQETNFRKFLKGYWKPGMPSPEKDDLRTVAVPFGFSLEQAQEIFDDVAQNPGNGSKPDTSKVDVFSEFMPTGAPDPEPPEIPPDKWPGDPSTDMRLDDLGNCERLVERFGKDLRYCHDWKKWFVWDGSRWRIDQTAEVMRWAKAVARDFHLQAADAQGSDLAKALTKHAHYSRSRAGIRGMVDLAQSEPGVPILPEGMDCNPWLLNCRNGTLDLQTGEFRNHCREDLLTKQVPVNYDPDQTDALSWDAFLQQIFNGNPNLIQFIQRAAGYSLTGSTAEQCFFVMHGSGNNGKTTLLTLLGEVLGDYAATTGTETLMLKRSGGIPNDLAALRGARFVSASETEDGRRLAESLIKQLTGGEAISARFLHAEFFEFTPTFKIFLATNHRPQIKGTDLAIWRRVRLIPFDVQIEKPDPFFPDKLRQEYPAILNWMVRGNEMWREGGLKPPAEVLTATQEYREEQDLIGGFLVEACRENDEGMVKAGELYDAFCELHGNRTMTKTAFGKAMSERGYDRFKKDGWYYLGLSFQE